MADLARRKDALMQQIEQGIDQLRRISEEMARGLSLITQAERMGGFGILVLDQETNELWISEGAYAVHGIRRLSAATVPDRIAELAHPDDVAAVQAGLAGVIEGREFDLVRPDGEVRLVHERAILIDCDDDHAPVVLGTVADVTPADHSED